MGRELNYRNSIKHSYGHTKNVVNRERDRDLHLGILIVIRGGDKIWTSLTTETQINVFMNTIT